MEPLSLCSAPANPSPFLIFVLFIVYRAGV